MPPMSKVTIRGKPVPVPTGTKSDTARYLLGEGYSVSEISKAVPMAYSQAHQIAKNQAEVARHEIPRDRPHSHTVRGTVETKAIREHFARRAKVEPAAPEWGDLPNTRKSTKPAKAKKLTPRIGKLRTPGLPSDIAVGTCANCGHDLVVRGGPTGYTFVHMNTTTEEYLAVTQFCNAVPLELIA